MFNFKIHQELTCIAEGSGEFFARTGAMIAYKGQFTTEKVLLDPNQNQSMFGQLVGYASRKITGENLPLMKVSGSGTYYMANRANHVSVIKLNPNQTLSVESENLLAFGNDCNYKVRFIGCGVVSQKGLFTTSLTGGNKGGEVCVITNGNPIVLETPCVVDPDAVVCWTGPDPGFKADVNWKTFIGQSSGESYSMEFNTHGEVVIVQPSERYGGIEIGID